jgi:Fur family peroxide stress response transcriptional regulator
MNVAADIERLRDYCKEHGIPLTQQKLEVFRELIWSGDHPSPEEMHRRLRKQFPTISLATIYKNLEALSRMGFARKINPLSDRARYDADLSSHNHFICTSCKQVFDIDPECIEGANIPDPEGFEHEISDKFINYVGICKTCKNNPRGAK